MRSSSGVKRIRTDDLLASPPRASLPSPTPNAAVSPTFRNVSACNRCRQRKNRCDRKLPACWSCEKAGVRCVGFDPITKREVPRAYVYYLESRVTYLEGLLADNGISFAAGQDFAEGIQSPPGPPRASSFGIADKTVPGFDTPDLSRESWAQEKDHERKLDNLVSNIGMVSVQGASVPRYLGSTSGISFARYAARPQELCYSTYRDEGWSSLQSKPLYLPARTRVGSEELPGPQQLPIGLPSVTRCGDCSQSKRPNPRLSRIKRLASDWWPSISSTPTHRFRSCTRASSWRYSTKPMLLRALPVQHVNSICSTSYLQ